MSKSKEIITKSHGGTAMKNTNITTRIIRTVALVLSVTEKYTSENNMYIQMVIADGDIIRIAWVLQSNNEMYMDSKKFEKQMVEIEIKEYASNGFVHSFVKGIMLYRGDENQLLEYLPNFNPDYEYMMTTIAQYTAYPGNGPEPIANLVFKILSKYREGYVGAVAGKSIHHTEEGGLLDHSVQMVRSAQKLCEIYGLDGELLVCGAAIHDIGKIFEMQSISGKTNYTTLGRLLGHPALGLMLIHYEARGCNYNKERLTLLEHIVASHHGCKNCGAIVEPATKEALLIHKLDGIDAKIDTFERAYEKIEDGAMSGMIKGLSTSVYKPLPAPLNYALEEIKQVEDIA